VLNHLDHLDLACHGLTRVAAFSMRSLPEVDALEQWLEAANPPWRQDPGGPVRLSELCATEDNSSYALHSLLEAAPAFLEWTAEGWRFKAGPTARKLLRLRLPLGTVHAAAAARADKEAIGDPPTAVVSDDIRYLLQSIGAVDNHVHVGTCLPFDGMFELLQRQLRKAPPNRRQLKDGETAVNFIDSDGTPFISGHALAVAALIGKVLDAFLNDSAVDFKEFVSASVPNSRFAEALLTGQSWAFLHQRNPSRPCEPLWLSCGEELGPTIEVSDEGELSDPYQQGCQRKLDLLRRVVEGRADPAYIRCVEDLLRCEALAHFALVQGNRAGLREFLSVSNRLSRLRRSLPEQSRHVVGYGLPHLSRAMRLTGVELRTAEQFDNHAGFADLARSLDAKLAGYQDALERLDPHVEAPRATWPICLIKTPQAVAAPEARPLVGPNALRFELRSMLELVRHTADLLIRFPSARRIVPGFDVAGDECAIPSWCFTLLFAVFDERLKETEGPVRHASTIRVHAGEDYFTPLQGLRRIYEAATWVIRTKPYARVGHALALSSAATQSPDRAPADQPLDEAFDDLVWAWGLLKDQPGQEDRSHLLATAVAERGEQIYELTQATPHDYLQAYEQRFELDSLLRLGVVARSAHGDSLTLMRELVPPVAGSMADRIMFTYLTDSESAAPCRSPLIDNVLLREVTDAVRPRVKRALRDHGTVIEACPTSNLIIGGIDDYSRHPLHDWLDDDAFGITINTDDPGLFSVTLADEYVHFWETSACTPSYRVKAVERMAEQSVKLMPSISDSTQAVKAVADTRAEFKAAGMSVEP
jgi:hypothetical protein